MKKADTITKYDGIGYFADSLFMGCSILALFGRVKANEGRGLSWIQKKSVP